MKSPTVSSRSGSLDVTLLEVRTARYSGACPSPPCFAGRVRISHLPRLAVIRPLRANPNAIPRIKRRGWSDLTYWSDPSRFPRMHGRCRHGVDAGAAGGRHTGPRARDGRIGAKAGTRRESGSPRFAVFTPRFAVFTAAFRAAPSRFARRGIAA